MIATKKNSQATMAMNSLPPLMSSSSVASKPKTKVIAAYLYGRYSLTRSSSVSG